MAYSVPQCADHFYDVALQQLEDEEEDLISLILFGRVTGGATVLVERGNFF